METFDKIIEIIERFKNDLAPDSDYVKTEYAKEIMKLFVQQPGRDEIIKGFKGNVTVHPNPLTPSVIKMLDICIKYFSQFRQMPTDEEIIDKAYIYTPSAHRRTGK